ncbi:hypothetical protein Tco_0164012 [Tanacetum coccineum]
MAPRAVLMKTGLKSVNTARPVNTVRSDNTGRPFSTARVLIVKPHNKTPYELFRGFKPAIGFMKPFGCHVTILNTLDNLGKFDGKSNEGFFVGYSLNSKAFTDASYFGDVAPRTIVDAQIEDKDGLQDENDAIENRLNTGSKDISTALPEDNTATPEDLVGPIPTTPQTRIHKDHPIEHVIGDVQSSVKTRRMKTSYSKLGFLSAIYEGKSHQDLHTCFEDLDHPNKVYKVVKALYGLHQALRAWSNRKRKVSPKISHLLAVKRIFRYLKGKPSLGLWYSKDSPLELVAYTDSDYAGATQDRKSTTEDCNAKKLIQMAKIDTEHNVADLLTKGFDAGRFQYLVSSIGMLNR